ncbi:MAG: sulfite exporter TauE/SafE family protein [Pseudomonadota bacterium]
MNPELSIAATAVICAVGFGVGIFGAVLGSTLFVLVPLLSAFGMPIHSAIGTAKVSVVGREMAPLAYFRSRGLVNLRSGLVLTITAVAAAQAGALCATWVNAAALERIVGLCMLLMAGATLLNADAGLSPSKPLPGGGMVKNAFAGILIGFYTGIFGGGANVLIVFALVYISGETFLGAVANSKLPNLVITAASLPVFVAAGYVDWMVAVPLTLATAAGAALGARLAVNRENRTLRIVFRVLIVVLAIHYLF